MVHLMSAGRLQLPRPRREGPEDADVPARASRTAASSCSPRQARSGARASGCCGRPRSRRASPTSAPRPTSSTRSRSARILASDSRRLHSLLRDQRLIAGIGRAWANEILHVRELSPYALSTQLDDEEIDAPGGRDPLRDRARDRAAAARARRTRPTYRVHDRLGEPCWRCGTPLAQRRLRGAHDLLLHRLPDRRPRAQGPPALAAAAMRIEQVTEATPELVATIERLLPQLSEARTPPTLDELAQTRRRRDAARRARRRRPRPRHAHARLVPRLVRAQGADRGRDRRRGRPRPGHRRGARRARRMRRATELGVRTVELTSMPYRESANRLYRRLGFVRKPTNVYVWWPR